MPEKNVQSITVDQPKKYLFTFRKETSETHMERRKLHVSRLDQTNKVLISLAPFQH